MPPSSNMPNMFNKLGVFERIMVLPTLWQCVCEGEMQVQCCHGCLWSHREESAVTNIDTVSWAPVTRLFFAFPVPDFIFPSFTQFSFTSSHNANTSSLCPLPAKIAMTLFPPFAVNGLLLQSTHSFSHSSIPPSPSPCYDSMIHSAVPNVTDTNHDRICEF